MRLEARRTQKDGKTVLRGLILVSESEEESVLIDECMGNKPDDDGLISASTVECRLSDGYGEHYLYVAAVPAE